MFFTANELQVNRRMQAHFSELVANREQFNKSQLALAALYGNSLSVDQRLAVNVSLTNDFWADVDRSIIQMRDATVGMEILTDLSSVQTILSVGKTAKLYTKVGEIAEDVSISMDGQAPYSFDHTEYDTDGDPIPVFSAGYGVNWRHAEGLRTVGYDLVQDSQEAKLKVYNETLVDYVLNGSDRAKVQTYSGQGLKTHRNTKKINLGAGGANINLTSASAADVLAFFTTGAFGQNARANRVVAYDVLWVSPEIAANIGQDYVVNGVVNGTLEDQIKKRGKVREIRETYALSGNEFLGYERRRDVVTPLVGMTTGITALPRPLPNSNFNFQILSALGIQVKADGAGRSGVVYGANLT